MNKSTQTEIVDINKHVNQLKKEFVDEVNLYQIAFANKINHISQYDELNKNINELEVFDAFLKDNMLLMRCHDNNYKTNNINVNQYEQMDIDKKYIMKEISKVKYEKVNMNNYKACSGYGNCEILNNFFTNKIFVENDINFTKPKNIKKIFYDIETYNCDGSYNNVPKYDSIYAKIGMICLYVDDKYKVYLSRDYCYNKDAITNKLKSRSNNEFDLEVNVYNSEIIMCQEFIKYVQEYDSDKTTKLLIGFNSSMGKDDKMYKKSKTYGYDLTFIMERLNMKYNTKIKYGVKMYYANEYKMVKTIDIMPSVYFVDFSVLLYDGLLKHKSEMKSYTLDSYLKLNKIEAKLEHNYKDMQMRLNENNCDISDIISYCLYDCYSLKLLDDKQKLIDDKLALIEIMNLPLNIVLYETISKMLEFSLIREYYKYGYVCQYNKKYDDNKTSMKYKGAYTQNIDECEQFKIQERLTIIDYISLYPSIMRVNNIDLININYYDYIKNIENNDCDENIIDISDDNYDVKTIGFDNKNDSIMNKYITSLFSKRKENKKKYEETRDKYFNALQLKYKSTINSLCGLFGCKTSCFYNIYIASAITSYGRVLIKKTIEYVENKNHQVVFVDTDSIVFRLNDIVTLEENNNFMIGINDYINTLVKCNRQNILKMEQENIWIKAILPANKKSYMKLYCSVDDYYKGDYDKAKLLINGITWSIMHDDIVEIIKNMCYMLLKDEKTTKDTKNIEFIIEEWIRKQSGVLQKAIIECDMKTIKLYSKFIRLSKSSVSEYIRTTYDVNENYIYIVKLKIDDKLSQSMIPINYLNSDNIHMIDVMYQISFIANQLKRFFKISDNIGKYYNKIFMKYDLLFNSSLITIREDYINQHDVIKSNFKQFGDINDLDKYISDNPDKSIHELILYDHKMYFDIDANDKNNFNVNQFVNFVIKQIGNCSYHIASACSQKKLSYHIVFDMICDSNYNISVAQDYNDMMNKKFCDIQVYSKDDKTGKTLRMINTPKSDFKNNAMVNRKFKIIGGSSFSDFIISNIDHMNFVETPYKYNNDSIVPINTNLNMKPEKSDIDLVEKYYNDKKLQFKIEFDEKNRFNVIKFDGKYNCFICDREHDSSNHFFYVTRKYLAIKCFRNAADMTNDKIKINRENNVKEITLNDIYEDVKMNKKEGTINNKEVTYDISSELNCVYSKPGTCKTTQLKTILTSGLFDNKKILVLSFRRSFSNDFANKFEKIKLTNYMDIKGHIDNDIYKAVILQIDSLMRYKYNGIDLLVIDEVESILTQLTSSQIKDRISVLQEFKNICKISKQILLLDACLMPSSIKFIKDISHKITLTNVVNLYKPKTEYKMSLNMFSNKNKDHLNVIYSRIKNEIINKKKIIIFCSLSNFAHGLEAELKKLNCKILILSGRDYAINENGKSMLKMKNDIFKNDINDTIINYDVFIYTSSLTAGVSIEVCHFDKCFIIYGENTCDVVSLYQSLHRARDLKDKYVEMYYEYHMKYEPITCKAYHDKYKHILKNHDDDIYNLDLFLQTRVNCLNFYKTELLLTYLYEDGYKLTFDDYANQIITDEIFENNMLTVDKIAIESFDKITITKEDIDLVDKCSKNNNDYEITDKDFEVKSKIIWNCRILGIDAMKLCNYSDNDKSKIKTLFKNIKEIKKIKRNKQMNIDEMINMLNAVCAEIKNCDHMGTVLKNNKCDRLIDVKTVHDNIKANELLNILKKMNFSDYVEKSIILTNVKNYCDKYKIDMESENVIQKLNAILKKINVNIDYKQVRKNKERFIVYKLNTNKIDVCLHHNDIVDNIK